MSWNDSLVSNLPAKMKVLSILAKSLEKQEVNFSRSTLFHMKTRVGLKYFVNDCLWKPLFDSNSPHTHSNLIVLIIW